MGLAYAVVIQDHEGADSNHHVGTRRSKAHDMFEKLSVDLHGDGVTSELRFEVWDGGKLLYNLTETVSLNSGEEDESDDDLEEEEEEESEESEEDEDEEEEEDDE